MIDPIPDSVKKALRTGVLCYLASPHPSGPHVTPVVFATHASRLWVTTSRRSVKARTWHRDDRVGGLVRGGDRFVTLQGRVTTYDLLEPFTWPRSLFHAPSLTRAAAEFTVKNARFFAGYAVDAYRVPLSWTPPGRVFAGISLDRLAVLDANRVRRMHGRFGSKIVSATTFGATASSAQDDPFALVPPEVGERVRRSEEAALALHSGRVPVVLPARWASRAGELYAVLPRHMLALAGRGPDMPASITIDQASQWRARAMTGLLVQGEGRIHLVDELGSGATSAEAVAKDAGVDPQGAAIVRVTPRRLVWWQGWDSGTVRL